MQAAQRFWSLTVCAIVLLGFYPAPLPAQEETTTAVHLEEAAICRQVENRTPIGIGSVFPAEIGRLYCFTKVVGATEDTAIVHHWYLNGKLKASITLPVKSASWRTWSSKDISPDETGDWMVELLSEDGKALESILFLVQ